MWVITTVEQSAPPRHNFSSCLTAVVTRLCMGAHMGPFYWSYLLMDIYHGG